MSPGFKCRVGVTKAVSAPSGMNLEPRLCSRLIDSFDFAFVGSRRVRQVPVFLLAVR